MPQTHKRPIENGARPQQTTSPAQSPSSSATTCSKIFKPVDIRPEFLGKTVAKFSTKVDTAFAEPRKLLIPKSRKPAGYQSSMTLSGQPAVHSGQQMNAMTGNSAAPRISSFASPTDVRMLNTAGEGTAKRRGTFAAPGTNTPSYVPIYDHSASGWRSHGRARV